jgi:glycosyltransferase involved in cell wall biosynthesis
VYPGLDDLPPAGNGPPPLSDRYALYVGATERHKNVGLLLDVWAAGRPAGLRLAIVGRPGRDHEHLSERANRLGSSVVLRGAVDDAELERWYRHASVFLFPSRTEGFGYPPLEAMQRGVPVIASTGGSLPEVLADGALFHDPDDAEALRVAVERVMQDPTLHESLVAAGRRRTQDFTWARTGERMAKLLRAIARGT